MAKTTKIDIEEKENIIDDKDVEIIDYKAEYEKLKAETEALKLENKKSEEDQDECNGDLSISPSKMINVTNLFYGTLYLEGLHGTLEFPGFGITRPMTFEDISHAQSKARTFATEGYFYIHDENAVKLLYLEDSYKHFVKKDKIKKILDLSEKQIKDLIGNTTQIIKDTIASMIVDGLVKDEDLDYQDKLFASKSKIAVVGDALGKDLIEISRQIIESNRDIK